MQRDKISILTSWIKSEILSYNKQNGQQERILTIIENRTLNKKDQEQYKNMISEILHNETGINQYKKGIFDIIKNLIQEFNIKDLIRDNDIENIKIKQSIQEMNKWEIKDIYDIFDCIKNYNMCIEQAKQKIRENKNWTSYLWKMIAILKNNIDWSETLKNEKEHIKIYIEQELEKEIEYFFAHHILEINDEILYNKKKRAEKTLDYISNFHNSTIDIWSVSHDYSIKEILNDDKIKYDYSITQELLYPKSSYIDNHGYIVFNENITINHEEINRDTLSLLSEWCNAILQNNYRFEYKLWKRITEELEWKEIYLQ